VVTTSRGAEGLDLRDGREARVADSDEDLATAILNLLDEPDRAGELAAAARARVENDFSWDASAAELLRVFAGAES
jgi:glycosyltransferase involved in cell wall biosynthesis